MLILYFTLPPLRLRAHVETVEIGKRHRLAVWKFHHKSQLPAHGFDVGAQRRKKEITTLFEPGHSILRDMQGFGHALLREFMRLAQIAQGHFFVDKTRGLGRDFLLLIGGSPLITSSSFFAISASLSHLR